MRKGSSHYRISDWDVDPSRGVVRCKEEEVRLEPKVVELLTYLVSRPGEVVSRTDLLDALWPGVVVSDEVITNTVAKLRRALHDDPKSPKIIETIPKKGYRILVSAIEAQNQRPPALTSSTLMIAAVMAVVAIVGSILLWRPWEVVHEGGSMDQKPLSLPTTPSVAVLPFTNLSNDKEQEFFVDGITEDLITDLSRFSGLFVIARNSSFAYKNTTADPKMVGRELGVRFVVKGSIRKLDNGFRLNIQLIDTATGGNVWAERYDSDHNGIFDIQDKITKNVIAALSVKATSAEENYATFQETYKPTAYHDFLKGWAAYRRDTPEDFATAITYFEKAIKEDPAYGRALSALAAVYWETYQKLWHRRLGISPLSLSWQRANEYLERSMVAPTPLAHKVASAMLTANRRYDEAITEAERAIAIDPNDPLGYVALADALFFSGSFGKSENLINKAMRLDPKNQAPYLSVLGKIQLAKGDVADAISSLERVIQHSPDNRLTWMALISAYGATNQIDKAKMAMVTLNKLQNRDKLVSFTVSYAREHWPFKSDNDMNNFLDGLRKAGVPEW